MSSSFVLLFSGDAAHYAVVRILCVRIINQPSLTLTMMTLRQ